jgi:minor histocompatibility antigen H13
VSYHAFVAKPWFLTNFLGFSFCYGSLQFMTPTTAWTGTLVLGALFFYDIYFVFFTPMMVTVATKLDVPIKLLFPRPDGCVFPVGAPEGSAAMEEYLQCVAKKRTMAMLGLGDIVVPGMMLAFALRFDLYLHYLRQGAKQKQQQRTKGASTTETPKPTFMSATGSWGERFWTSPKVWSKEIQAKQFPKPYLYATIVGYVTGMVVTVVVMQVAQHAQPALLYLVPGVLLSLWGTALVKGDLKVLWAYSELPEDQETKKEAEKKEEHKDEKAGQEDKPSDPSDIKTVSNGTIEASPESGQGMKTPETKTVEMKSDAKEDRQLIHFSIMLPNPTHETETESTTAENKASLGHEASSEKANSSAAIAGGDSDQADVKAMGDGVNGFAGRNDGEPPGKRARRS